MAFNDIYVQISGVLWALYQIYNILLIVYILMSWLPNVRESVVGVWLGKLVEPYLSPFRKLIPPIGGMLDISPILALFALRYVVYGIDGIIYYILVFFSKMG